MTETVFKVLSLEARRARGRAGGLGGLGEMGGLGELGELESRWSWAWGGLGGWDWQKTRGPLASVLEVSRLPSLPREVGEVELIGEERVTTKSHLQ